MMIQFHLLKPSCFQMLPFVATEPFSYKKLYPHTDCLVWNFFILCLMTCEPGHDVCDNQPIDMDSMAAPVWSLHRHKTVMLLLICSPLKATEVKSMLFIWISSRHGPMQTS